MWNSHGWWFAGKPAQVPKAHAFRVWEFGAASVEFRDPQVAERIDLSLFPVVLDGDVA
jgi:hypothetical protein